MPRANTNVARHKRKKRIRKAVRGYSWARGHLLKEAKIAIRRSGRYAFRDRKLRARDFRSLWIIRVKAAAVSRGLRYAQLIQGLALAGIRLNRKMLSEIAVIDPTGFDAIFKLAKDALDKHNVAQEAARKAAASGAVNPDAKAAAVSA